MSGHSKWATTRRQKAVVDAKRGIQFTKLSHAITVAAKEGGGDLAANTRLRLAVETARASSMPKDNIERAIHRGTGALAGMHVESITYEGFGPGSTALFIEALTDNRNRTVAEVKNIFSKHSSTLGNPGSTAWMFSRYGMVTLSRPEALIDELALIDLGADDLMLEDEAILLLTTVEGLVALADRARLAGWTVTEATLTYLPKIPTEFPTGKTGEQLLSLLTTLDEHDDIVNVYCVATA
ncbi:MAG: YebC/PmpR family DNA-binding transcriptional regulator [Patescibacteria group bacterium]|jgi:YebC/PmpR family DNA-binding regulatory protein